MIKGGTVTITKRIEGAARKFSFISTTIIVELNFLIYVLLTKNEITPIVYTLTLVMVMTNGVILIGGHTFDKWMRSKYMVKDHEKSEE